MEQLKEIKREFDDIAIEVNSKVNCEIRGLMHYLKSTWGWSNEELSYLLDEDESDIEVMLSEGWDGTVDSGLLVQLYLLTLGRCNIPGCCDNDKSLERMEDIIGKIQMTKAPLKTRDEKIQTILDMFGVKDDDSLDRLLQAVVDVRSAINAADDDSFKSSCKNVEKECVGNHNCECHQNKDEKCICSTDKNEVKEAIKGVMNVISDIFNTIYNEKTI